MTPVSMPPVALSWVRVEKYCEYTGDTMNMVADRMHEGLWAAGKHYKRTSQRVLWINLQAVEEWINRTPHVEATFYPGRTRSPTRTEK